MAKAPLRRGTASNLRASVYIVPSPGEESNVAASASSILDEKDLERIAEVVNRSIQALQTRLDAVAQEKPSGVGLSEVMIKFGIDLQGEAKIPLIGPLLQIGYKAGATFQVEITLSRQPQIP